MMINQLIVFQFDILSETWLLTFRTQKLLDAREN